MKIMLAVLVFSFLIWTGEARAQQVPPAGIPTANSESATPTTSASNDAEQLRADLQRLKIILNQMRSNLAFVQTTQTPLKHQFELDVDAWQVMVEQMNRRLERMEQEEKSRRR